MMKLLIFVLLSATVRAQTKNCKDLALRELDALDLVSQSPLRVVYANDPDYSCSSVFYTTATDPSSYTIGSTYNKGDKVLANLQLTFDDSNKFDTVTSCSDGAQSKHLFLDVGFTQYKGYCIFTCSDDGVSLTTLRCMNSEGFNQTVFDKVLKIVQGVDGAPPTGTPIDTCADPTGGCAYFNF